MANYPDRCQHIKVNGTQCGSPALRRNRFCFFHKRFQDQRINLATDRKRRGAANFILPVLEDANSVQIAIMQVMRMLVTGQMDHKTASLLLYALQTASANLRQTNFSPLKHNIILDPRDAANSLLDEHLWEDEDFEEEDETEEETAKSDDPLEPIRERQRQRALEWDRKEQETVTYFKEWSKQHPNFHLIRNEDGFLRIDSMDGRTQPTIDLSRQPEPTAKTTPPPATNATHPATQPAQKVEAPPQTTPAASSNAAPKKPATSAPTEEEFKQDINALTRKHFFPNMPDEVYEAAVKKLK